MNISKEVKTGLLAAAALVIFFAGFYFLKGADIFTNDKEYYCYYPSVDGLQKASLVQIKGLNVGHVSDIELAGDKGVKVTIAVNNKLVVPTGTIASFAQTDLLGGKIIRLDLGPGPGAEPAGATLKGIKDGGTVEKISDALTPRLQELQGTIVELNKVLSNVNTVMGEENQKSVAATLQSLKETSANLNQISGTLNKESSQISSIIRNTNSITGNLAKSNDTIQRILSNTSKVTSQLANAPIQKTIQDLQKTATELQAIMAKINNSQGSMGLLVNDKELYNNMNKSLKSITNLTDDLKAHPGRYINVSVFGGKNKN